MAPTPLLRFGSEYPLCIEQYGEEPPYLMLEQEYAVPLDELEQLIPVMVQLGMIRVEGMRVPPRHCAFCGSELPREKVAPSSPPQWRQFGCKKCNR